MRLVIKENILSEQEGQTLEAEMHPEFFIKLTTPKQTYNNIKFFVSDEKNIKSALTSTKRDERRDIVQKIIGVDDVLAVSLVLGALSFIQPLEDVGGYGKFDSSKVGTIYLGINENNKVVEHGGRQRSIYMWINKIKNERVLLKFLNKPKETPRFLQSQESSLTVPFAKGFIELLVDDSKEQTFQTMDEFRYFLHTRLMPTTNTNFDDFVDYFNKNYDLEIDNGEKVSLRKGIVRGLYDFIFDKDGIQISSASNIQIKKK